MFMMRGSLFIYKLILLEHNPSEHYPSIRVGEVIIFASQRTKVEALVAALTKQGVKAGAIHGDMDQVGRVCGGPGGTV